MANRLRSLGYEVNATKPHWIGMDLGGTKISAAVVDAETDPAGCRDTTRSTLLGPISTAPTPSDRGPAAVLDAAVGLISDVVERYGSRGPLRIGIGTAGLVDSSEGRIVSSTDAIRDWSGTVIESGIRTRLRSLGYGQSAIHVENDVNTHAIGEAVRGSGTDCSSLLFVTVGTGVGAAFVDDGAPRRGAHSGAGEIGHMPTPGAEGRRCPCGRYGHLEAAAAGPAWGVDTASVVATLPMLV